jgi:acyl-CoA thioester hydrolase
MTDYTDRPFYVRLDLPVRGYDIDFAHIVSNIVYVRWLEDLRTAMLDQYFPLDRQVVDNYVPVVMSTHIEYKKPVVMFDQPVGHMWIKSFEKVRWINEAEIVVGSKVVAQATQTGVFVRLDSKRPIPLPAELRRRFEQHGQAAGESGQ